MIAAGSLLGVAIHQGVSFPVGKVDQIELHPMSFREFLDAMDESALSQLMSEKNYPLINDFNKKFSFWLKNYYYVGGMPETMTCLASDWYGIPYLCSFPKKTKNSFSVR